MVSISGYSGKNNAYFYVTTSPTSSSDLKAAISTGVEHFGNTADFNYIQTGGIINMSGLFQDNSTFNGDISLWDTSGIIQKMSQMFWNATAFNGDISQWNTSKVTHMDRQFRGATAFNGDLSAWNTSSVINMKEMFYGARAFNSDISAWDTSKVTTMLGLFFEATDFNQNLDAWATKLKADVIITIIFNLSGLAGNEPCWYSASGVKEC